jgi:hypothetical protein
MMLERTCPFPSRTAAAVSSQEVSMPRMGPRIVVEAVLFIRQRSAAFPE